MHKKKLTSMIWRGMGETAVYSVLVLGTVIYFLQYYGYLRPFESWFDSVTAMTVLTGITILSGLLFGTWQSSKTSRRLDQIRDSMLFLEKGDRKSVV